MKLTPRQAAALAWGKQAFGRRLKARLKSRPEELPLGYRHIWFNPFGIAEWNEHMRILHRMAWQGKL